MNRCIKCGQFVGLAFSYWNVAGDRLCPRCYDPDLVIDRDAQSHPPADLPGYDYPWGQIPYWGRLLGVL